MGLEWAVGEGELEMEWSSFAVVCCCGTLALDVPKDVDPELTWGGRGRLEVAEPGCEACCARGTDGADAVRFSRRGCGVAIGCWRRGLEPLGSMGALVKA